jgi:hypothetical protein
MKTTKTNDLYEAAAIQAYSGFRPIELEEENRKIIFVFEDRKEKNKEIDEVIQLYWNGRLMVSAQKYAEALRDLKQRLFIKK